MNLYYFVVVEGSGDLHICFLITGLSDSTNIDMYILKASAGVSAEHH